MSNIKGNSASTSQVALGDDNDIQKKKEEKTNCKACNKEVFKSKVIMHIKRNLKCKKHYGSELDDLEKEQDKKRKEYQTKYQEKYHTEYRKLNKAQKYFRSYMGWGKIHLRKTENLK